MIMHLFKRIIKVLVNVKNGNAFLTYFAFALQFSVETIIDNDTPLSII